MNTSSLWTKGLTKEPLMRNKLILQETDESQWRLYRIQFISLQKIQREPIFLQSVQFRSFHARCHRVCPVIYRLHSLELVVLNNCNESSRRKFASWVKRGKSLFFWRRRWGRILGWWTSKPVPHLHVDSTLRGTQKTNKHETSVHFQSSDFA